MNSNNKPLIFFSTCSLSIIGFSYLAILPSNKLYLSVSIILVAILLLMWIYSKSAINYLPVRVSSSLYFRLFTFLLALVTAWIWAIGWGLVQLENRLPQEWEGKDITLEGYISGIPRNYTNRYSFNLKTSRIITAPSIKDSYQNTIKYLDLIRVSWYRMPAEVKLVPGQLWRFTLRIRRPYSFMNPGGFDYEVWNLRQGIDATSYVKGEGELLGSSNKMWLDQQRWLVYEKISKAQIPRAGFISALMIGERGLISNDENEVIRNTGIAHLLAISGLHLTLVGGGMFWLIFWLLGISRRLVNLSFNNNTLALAARLALCFIWLYALWTGFSLPAQRAAIMLSVFMLALITKRFQSPLTIFFLAMTLVLLLDPLAATSGGFYLSFTALVLVVLSIRYFIPRVKPVKIKLMPGTSGRILNYGFDLLLTQLVLLAGLLPVVLVFFNQTSIIGILVNLIAIPITSFVIMPWVLITNLLIFISPTISELSLIGLAGFIDWLYTGLTLANAIPLAIITIPSPSKIAILSAILAIPILIWWIRPYNYLLALIMLLPCLVPSTEKIPHGEFRVHFIDVGQGLAVHLQTASHNLLYDTGTSFSSGNDIGELVLTPYLRELGIDKLDALLISHKDKDHSGGMRGVINNIQVDKLMLDFPYKQNNQRTPDLILPCHKGIDWQWDGVKFTIIHPLPKAKSRKTNDLSCVLLVESGENSLLLTGDITTVSEKLLAINHPKLQVDLLQAPHHGSKTSSSYPWLKQIAPKYAVFAAGYRNPFYHPHPTILENYELLNIEKFTTWRTGRVSFHVNNHNITHKDSYRKSRQRYWHYQAP